MPGLPKRYHDASEEPGYLAFPRYGDETTLRFWSAITLIVGFTTFWSPPDIMKVAPFVSSVARNLSAVGTSRMLGSTEIG